MTNPLKALWIGKATIYDWKPTTDPITHQTVQELVPIVTDEPCRLSHSSKAITGISEGAVDVEQIITLFISPDIEITHGCEIVVTQRGRTKKYRRGSEPSIYTNHQEVTLEYKETVEGIQ